MSLHNTRVLVAGMGNVLRGDDGFGIEVVRRLKSHPDLPPEVSVIEAGSAGLPLVQDLLDGYSMLIIVDAVSQGKPPGTVVTLEPAVPDVRGSAWEEIGALVGDPHTTVPSRVLLLARALGALPEKVVIVGCEPHTVDELQMSLTPPVAAAVDETVERVLTLAQSWLAGELVKTEASAVPRTP